MTAVVHCEKRELGGAALDYVEETLRSGLTLARLVVQSTDLERGTVYTFLPPHVNQQEAVAFTEGGKLPTPPESQWLRTPTGVLVPVPSTISYVANFASTSLSDGQGRVYVLEDQVSSPRSPHLENLDFNTLTVNAEVYYMLTGKDSTEDRVEKAIRTAETVPVFISFLSILSSSWRHSLTRSRRTEVELEALAAIASTVTSIIIGAYDGESYLIWQRQGTWPPDAPQPKR